MSRQRLGGAFGWLWTGFAASTAGTWLGFGAFPLIAVTVLGAGPAQVSALAAAGTAVGALLALPLGPWAERRRKRPVMIGADAVRCAALLSIPAAYWCGLLTYTQLLAVSAVTAAAGITFTSVGGAHLKQIVRPEHLVVAHGRFEATTWTATTVGPVAGGAAVGLLGPVATVAANALGFLASALAVAAIRGREERPARPEPARAADLVRGWRFIHADPVLRPLFRNTVAVNALIMATEPLLAVLLLGELGWSAWQYGMALGLPCLGGLCGARLAPRLEARYGRRRVLRAAGTLRAVWPLGLVPVVPGPAGMVLVIAVQAAMITCIGVFNPLFAAERLRRVPAERAARVLVAWNVTRSVVVAAVTALWGLLAAVTGARSAIAAAGVLLLLTPLLLSAGTHRPASSPTPESDGRLRPPSGPGRKDTLGDGSVPGERS
ncbi:MFS transporter [Nocardiopsis changdeensis]|uniref:MFS transporter n=1 Tax=Nocardiopsis changdeensis TaxID=2831969 RepID=UPI003F48EA6E